MVHAVAPGATIVEVPLAATSLNNPANAVAAFVAALRLGTSVGGIISISAAGQTGESIAIRRPRWPPCTPPSRLPPPITSPWSLPQRHRGGRRAVPGARRSDRGRPLPAVKEVNLPASDPLVLAAGGTSSPPATRQGLHHRECVGAAVRRPGEPVSGLGRRSQPGVLAPGYQNDVPGTGVYRGVPDVAAAASPHSGMAVITSTGGKQLPHQR